MFFRGFGGVFNPPRNAASKRSNATFFGYFPPLCGACELRDKGASRVVA
jgi:hypothetical protein